MRPRRHEYSPLVTRPRTVLPVLLLAVCWLVAPIPTARAQVSCTPGTAAVCDDGDPCTVDPCIANLCQNLVIPGCASCVDEDDCDDDGDPCTAEVCDAGRCAVVPATGATCDDGEACTTGDTCQDGRCGGTPLSCDDGFACTADACQAGACLSQPNDAACVGGGECAASACLPGNPGADASGCVSDPTPFDARECTADGDPCTVDQCQTAVCTHAPVSDVAKCSPVRPSYGRAVTLRSGVDRVLSFVENEASVNGQSGALVVAQLTDLRTMLDASIRALGGLDTGPLPGGPRPRLPANPTIAQLRGTLALVWLRGAPGRASKFMGAVSRGRRKKEIDPGAAGELRRNGRILLAGTKALKRDVKNLQKTFSIFQR